jgi:hypothetical protein
MVAESEARMTEVARLIAARERVGYTFECGFLGLGKKPIPTLKIRVATKGEQDRAVLAAHKYVDEIAKGVGVETQSASQDRDILTDAKTCFILFEVCRDVADARYPAFPGPRWMIDHLTTDEIAVLLNCYGEVLRITGTLEYDLATDRIEALSQALAAVADSDVPNQLLLRYTREQVGEICVRQAILLDERRQRAG